MRVVCTSVLLACFVLAPLAADAESWNRCKRMTRQIGHFYDVVELARERGNTQWELATRRHLSHLESRQLRQCPKYLARAKEVAALAQHEKNVQEMKKLMQVAAELAMKYYTGGLY